MNGRLAAGLTVGAVAALVGGAIWFVMSGPEPVQATVSSHATQAQAPLVPQAPLAPLAPLVTTSVAAFADESTLDRTAYSAFMNATLADGSWLAGAWFDQSSGQLVGAVSRNAPAAVLADAQRLVGPSGRVVMVDHSWRDLTRASEQIFSEGDPSTFPGELTSTSINAPLNRVVVTLTKITPEARMRVAQIAGPLAAVSSMPMNAAKVR